MKEKWIRFLERMGLLPEGNIFYIGGSDVLPPPLKGAEEAAALQALEEGDEGAKQRLIEHNLRLVAHIVRKYYTAHTGQDDLLSIGTIGLIKAVDSYSVRGGARFATYAARCIQNAILSQRNARLLIV